MLLPRTRATQLALLLEGEFLPSASNSPVPSAVTLGGGYAPGHKSCPYLTGTEKTKAAAVPLMSWLKNGSEVAGPGRGALSAPY